MGENKIRWGIGVASARIDLADFLSSPYPLPYYIIKGHYKF